MKLSLQNIVAIILELPRKFDHCHANYIVSLTIRKGNNLFWRQGCSKADVTCSSYKQDCSTFSNPKMIYLFKSLHEGSYANKKPTFFKMTSTQMHILKMTSNSNII